MFVYVFNIFNDDGSLRWRDIWVYAKSPEEAETKMRDEKGWRHFEDLKNPTWFCTKVCKLKEVMISHTVDGSKCEQISLSAFIDGLFCSYIDGKFYYDYCQATPQEDDNFSVQAENKTYHIEPSTDY
jgi:hypothetical protein